MRDREGSGDIRVCLAGGLSRRGLAPVPASAAHQLDLGNQGMKGHVCGVGAFKDALSVVGSQHRSRRINHRKTNLECGETHGRQNSAVSR